MNYLAINTAGKIEILLKINKRYYSSSYDDVSTMALPHINELLLKAKSSINDIDVFGVCIGPGSFTGIRVGLSMIKALAYALDKPIIAVTYFDILAYDNNIEQNELTTVIDGKNNVSYIRNGNGEGVCIMKEDIKKYALKNIIYDTQYKGCGLKLIIEEKIRLKEFFDHSQIAPLYLRKSQPERQDGEI